MCSLAPVATVFIAPFILLLTPILLSLGFGFIVFGLGRAGLIVTLFVTRRRAWIRITGNGKGEARVEFAALARGDDPGLGKGLDELVHAFSKVEKSTLRE